MTDMLDKVALEVAKGLQDAPVPDSFSMADVNGWTEDKSYEIARAALMAMRSPSRLQVERAVSAVNRERWVGDHITSADVEPVWKAMLDGASFYDTPWTVEMKPDNQEESVESSSSE